MYYIASKNFLEGKIGSDACAFELYFELGWEMVTTHFIVKRYIKTGIIKNDDVIVTQEDRKFLYEGVFNNVISYKEFIKLGNVPSIDLVKYIQRMTYFTEYFYTTDNPLVNGDYRHFEDDYNEITNFKKSNISENEPYVCLLVRKRDHDKYRNINDDFAKQLINILPYKIFICGKGTEYLCDNIKTFHISLQDFATLCNNEKCIANIGTLSGGMFIPAIFSKAKYNITIDVGGKHELMDGIKYNNPLFLSKSIRFSKSEFIDLELDENTISIINKIMKQESIDG